MNAYIRFQPEAQSRVQFLSFYICSSRSKLFEYTVSVKVLTWSIDNITTVLSVVKIIQENVAT